MENSVKDTFLDYNDRLVQISQGDPTRLRREASYYKFQFEVKKRKIAMVISLCRELKGLKSMFLLLKA